LSGEAHSVHEYCLGFETDTGLSLFDSVLGPNEANAAGIEPGQGLGSGNGTGQRRRRASMFIRVVVTIE
jgi:hypothetical protein